MSSFDVFKKATTPQSTKPMSFDTVKQNKQNIQNAALKGYLLNNNIKKDASQEGDSFESILQSSSENINTPAIELPEKSAFDVKKAILPVAIVTGATILSSVGISAFIAKYSNHVAKDTKIIRPPDLPRCINIVEEPHLAMYRALRDPSLKNILGLVGVSLFSFFTLGAKTLVDSAKEIWIKKQNCDIDYDLQESLIEVERDSFSGKLGVVNTLLNDTANYFRNSLDKTKKDVEFKQFLSFNGQKENNETKKQDNKNKLTPWIVAGASIAAFCSIALIMYKNLEKTSGNIDSFIDKIIDSDIKDKITKAQGENKESAIKELIKIFKSINISEKDARNKLKVIQGITDKEIDSVIEKLKDEHEHIFAQAPEALGGVAEKIQYYCYVNEERGHLYNWILNPENKWNKYLFLSFCLVSSVSYLAKAAADATKQVAVSRENMKSELNLRRRLVAVEVNNFKAKKLSAINPMIDNFKFQKSKGKSKEELTSLAQNILLEIKNGPPYIYN